MTLTLNYAAASDVGLVRTNNEDSAFAGQRLLALADGMGGHAAGEVASQLLISALAHLEEDAPGSRLLTRLAEATDEGNRAIAAYVEEHPSQEGMGCTLTALLFDGDRLGLCHVGDSRAYLLRDGELTQITKDDTFVQSLVDDGKLDPEDVSSHPQRSLILKALTGRAVEPTLSVREAREGDRYLLCSDGLSDPVSRDTIKEILDQGTPAEVSRRLIEIALRGGGPDNVTVVVADVVDAATPGLPADPVLSGAVNLDAPEIPRPDTAASRAVGFRVLTRAANASHGTSAHSTSGAGPTLTPGAAAGSAPAPGGGTTPSSAGTPGPASAPGAGDATPGGAAAAGAGVAAGHDGADLHAGGDTGATRPRRRGLWVTLAVVVVLLVAAGAGGWYAYQRIGDTYYVTTDGDRIVVDNGVPGSVLGVSLHSRSKDVCLTPTAQVRLLDPGSDSSCHRFTTRDLTPAARGTLEGLPQDSFDAVQGQIQRLAGQTLPACVTRERTAPGAAGDRGDRPGAPAATSAPATPGAAPSAPATPSAAPRTGDADPEDLTTPGVSCREVS